MNCPGSAPAWSAGVIPTTRPACAKSPIPRPTSSSVARCQRNRDVSRWWVRGLPARPGAGWPSGFGFELSGKGFAVVSGLARGIDSEAHQGALDAAGHTVAVIGCGIDVIYPPENRKLAEAIIAGGGAMMSELPVGTPPVAENFPVRNRLISGLCLGVVVVEAAEKSGSLITARMALEQDRQVFAVPGSPLTGKSRGSNRLIKEGARLVDCVEDVLEDLAPQLIPAEKESRPGR